MRGAEWETVDVRELVTRMCEGYRAVHPGRTINIQLPDTPLMLRCAPELIAQALDKLVDNAITLTSEQDEVTILIEHDSEEVRLQVRNSGTRLPDALQERLFDSLVSVRSHRGDTPHLGLGLYIVRLVAEAHNGRVTRPQSGISGCDDGIACRR